ncbi:unnamed protein product [Urochloa decumbens]|uniref:Ubiquitin-like protease family profile domain-containing protein n=1 Tax=Urochloa decumbens TaxID=240449 RepID=A0ABC9FXH3_9POAL
MARKRPSDFIDVSSSPESDEVGFGVGFEAQLADGLKSSEDTYSGDPEESENVDYDSVMKDYAAIKVLKRKLALGFSRLHGKGFSCPNDAFARFSMAGFSSVIDALTADNKKVIEDYGFGSLLQFDNCTVPNSFAKWVVGLINYRSGDIISNDKVISLTKETVNLVLGIPLTEKPFPRNSSSDISVVLGKFNKKSVPSVSFFANKLLQHEPMSDEDVFICFIIVAMNNFLCPTNSDSPCLKYFGLFEDITTAKELDWCGYVLDWLLEGVKNFNIGKASKSCDADIVAGCIYYLAVIYLDHVNFGSRQLPQTIPRICVWKGSMIKQYCDFDLKSTGCYGSHPLVETCHSCYSKDLRNLFTPMPSCSDAWFNSRLDEYAGCKLPSPLKVNLWKLVQNYCLDSGLSINMDVQSFNAMPDDMKLTFCKLLQHAYSVDSRSQKLVLDVIKLFSQFSNEDFSAPSNEHHNLDNLDNVLHSVISPQCEDDETVHISDRSAPSTVHQACEPILNENNADDGNGFLPLPVPNLKRSMPKMCPKANNVDVARVMKNLNKSRSGNASTSAKKPSASQNQLSANSQPQTMHCTNPINHNVDSKRIPLDDLSNDLSAKRKKKSVSFSPQGSSHADVSMVENLNFYAPDSVSPVSIPRLRRFNPDKDLLHLQKAYLSRMSSPTDISDISNGVKSSSSEFNHQASPEVQIISERILCDGGRGMVKNSDVLYNSKLTRPQSTVRKPSSVPGNTPSCSRPLLSNPAPSSTQRARESTTFGKLCTARDKGDLVGGQGVSKCVKYHVSKSETLNYEAICSLAFFEYQGEDAVYLYGVRCTFWSLGESLKPDGYYFFSNIADNLLKNFDEADEDVISRAFKRLSKTRPVTHSNMLFSPSFYDDHWFIFVVDIKQRKYVMLDSLYKEDDDYQLYVSQRMRASFEYHWQKILQVDIGFEDFQLIYPAVPRQPPGHENDSGIYAMMFLEHWLPSSNSLSSLFRPKDIPSIRIKIANDLVFQPKNSGMKHRVTECYVQFI